MPTVSLRRFVNASNCDRRFVTYKEQKLIRNVVSELVSAPILQDPEGGRRFVQLCTQNYGVGTDAGCLILLNLEYKVRRGAAFK